VVPAGHDFEGFRLLKWKREPLFQVFSGGTQVNDAPNQREKALLRE
jgi:hypothetical protein